MTTPTPLLPRRQNQELWRACLRGQEPAESLSTRQREQLVMLLFDKGWSVLQIALHTRETEYTTARIRCRGEQVRRAFQLPSPVSHGPLVRSAS